MGLRNWPVRSKLIAVLAIPAVALLALASVNVRASLNDAQSLRAGGELAQLERSSTALVHELQLERDLTAGQLVRSDLPPNATKADKATRAEIDKRSSDQRASVDEAAATFSADVSSLRGSASPAIRAQLDALRARLDGLDALRSEIARRGLSQQAILDEYSRTIDGLLAIDLPAALQGGDAQLTEQVQSLRNLSQVKELTSQVRGTLYALSTRNRFGFGQFQNLADLLAQQRAAVNQYLADANDEQRGLFGGSVKGQAVLQVLHMQQTALAHQAQPELDIDPDQWLAASTTQIELQRNVEDQLLTAVIDKADSLAGDAQLRSLRDAALIAIALMVALLSALAIAQSMVRPLRRLRRNALEVAQQRLPEAVHQTAVGHTDVEVVRIGGTARDEIGQVARAFDSIHLAAIDLATEQAALRRSISEMFLNLARRSQTLIDRLLEQLDDLEREADSDTLEKLFGVDHLATRLRRTAEGLIVLSGAPEPPRRWVEPIPMMDVVRAAVQEVEDYQRVEVLPIDNVQLTGYAVSEVVHLLAELIENATRFSPPGTVVRIGGQPSGSGHVIEIEDRGIGMSDVELERANERLTNPPAVDAAVARQLGLAVIGRLARRHDIRVQLRHSFYGGITALVLLPAKLTSQAGYQTVPAPTGPRAELPAPALASGPTAPIGGRPYGAPFDPSGRGALPAGVGQAARSPGAGAFEDDRPTGPFESAGEPAGHDGGPAGRSGPGGPAGGPARPAMIWPPAPGEGRRDPGGRGAPAGAPGYPTVRPPAPVGRYGDAGNGHDEPFDQYGRQGAPGDDEQSQGEDLPIFEQARAQWFQPPTGATRPSRRQPAAPGAAPRSPRAPTFSPAGPPPPPVDQGMATAAPPLRPDVGEAQRSGGLPRRMPRANLAEGLRGGPPPGFAPTPAGTAAPRRSAAARSRSPEEIRAMLSSYRSGVERGRRTAATPPADAPRHADRGYGDPSRGGEW